MFRYKSLYLIGTSHISPESTRLVKTWILKHKPDIVALELDKKRLNSLKNKKRRLSLSSIKRIGLTGFLFNLLGAFLEKQLSKTTKTPPGSDMKSAYESALKINSKVVLIDQDIETTIKKISSSMTLKEKLRFIKDILTGLIVPNKEFDLKKVPDAEVIEKLTKKMKAHYPSLYKLLVEERNLIMAKNLYNLQSANPDKKILAVVGAGHQKEILGLLKNADN